MYEGQTLICQSIIEDNWLEFLKYVKARSDNEVELQKKRIKALEGVEGVGPSHSNLVGAVQVSQDDYRYYEISLNSFWNWYITNKV